MKVILLFDYHGGCPTCGHLTEYREYELNEDLKDHLADNGTVQISFKDPFYGSEVFEAKKVVLSDLAFVSAG